MDQATTHQYHHHLALIVDNLREAVDRRGFVVLSGPCPSCLATAWMSAIHPMAVKGESLWVTSPGTLMASMEYNEHRGLDVDAFLEHMYPMVLVFNAAADEADPNEDPAATLALQERVIRARLRIGLPTLLLTHQHYADMDPDLLERAGSDAPFLTMPQHHPSACVL